MESNGIDWRFFLLKSQFIDCQIIKLISMQIHFNEDII